MIRAEMLWADDDLVQVALKQLGDDVSVYLIKEFIDYDRSCYAKVSRCGNQQLAGDSPSRIVSVTLTEFKQRDDSGQLVRLKIISGVFERLA